MKTGRAKVWNLRAGWGSWLGLDQGQFLSIALGIFLISILYRVIRRSPRRWWFYFWLISLPIASSLFFFSRWLWTHVPQIRAACGEDPGLTASLEQMVQRAGQTIPPERMFWMGAAKRPQG